MIIIYYNHFGFLRFLPASLESLTLERIGLEQLITALRNLSNAGGLKRLEIWNFEFGPMEKVTHSAWKKVFIECHRLKIQLEIVES